MEDSQLNAAYDRLRELKISKANFDLAEEYATVGDYLEALSYYESVIPEDENYEKALTKDVEVWDKIMSEFQTFLSKKEYGQAREMLEDISNHSKNPDLIDWAKETDEMVIYMMGKNANKQT